MLFPTHLVVAALLGRVSRLSPLWLAAGAALPDLVDKPLAAVGVTELFHTVGHTALLAVPMLLVARYGPAPRAVAVGWGSHLVLDALHVVVNGRPNDALFLVWPLAVPSDPLNLAPYPFFLQYLWTPSFFIEVVIWLAVATVAVRELAASRRSTDRRP